jgi:putative DNA methylase
MGEGSGLYLSVLRAVLYALMELAKHLDGDEVLRHLTLKIHDLYGDATQRDLAIELAGYLAEQLKTLRPEEASAARVLRELVLNQRTG